MDRMRPYDVPHKGLRNALSQFSLLAGKTDYSNRGEVKALYDLGSAVFKILTIHAEDEDEITLKALDERSPGAAQHDRDDHEALHEFQHRLEQQLESIYEESIAGNDTCGAGAEFYLSLSEYHGLYLAHTAEEERVTQPLLWNCFTDDELADHRAAIMARNPSETLLTWFRFVIPAQSHSERLGLLSGFKKRAPEAFFEEAMRVIGSVLPASDFTLLEEELAAV